MASFLSQTKKVIKKADLIIEVVDARFPIDSRNFELERMIKKLGKEYMIIINKSDLVPEEFLKKAAAKISKEVPTIYFSSIKRKGTRKVVTVINKLRHNKSVKIGVIGYPNVGKSAIINILKGKHVAATAAKPGSTKGIQFLKISSNILLIDTPGVVPIKGKKSAFLRGAIPIEQVDSIEDSTMSLISKFVKEGVANKVKDKYGVSVGNIDSFLERFAKKYNYIKKGNLLDTERAARKIYQDWIKGNLRVWWLPKKEIVLQKQKH